MREIEINHDETITLVIKYKNHIIKKMITTEIKSWTYNENTGGVWEVKLHMNEWIDFSKIKGIL